MASFERTDAFPGGGGCGLPPREESGNSLPSRALPRPQPADGGVGCDGAGAAESSRRPREEDVAEILQDFAASSPRNEPHLCCLEPRDFVEQVIKANVAVDDGDWVQPLYRQDDGVWRLCKVEVLYRMHDASHAPFPAFANFVKAATDQCAVPDPELRAAFDGHVMASLRRVDAYLSQMEARLVEVVREVGICTAINVTAKQLRPALELRLQNADLLALEETEYDAEPEDVTELRRQAWEKFGALSLDDVAPSAADLKAFAPQSSAFAVPAAPDGSPYKALPASYNHDFRAARRFIQDFRRARATAPRAQAEVKFAEEFCCYLVGVGYAPFSREAMRAWREANPEASDLVRSLGADLVREAVDAGMVICLEVSFEDSDARWLLDAVPDLRGRLCKQGGRSGGAALPLSRADRLWNQSV